MTWNHRIFVQRQPNGEDWYTLREAFYGENKETPHSWTAEPIDLAGESLEDLVDTLERIRRCLDKPVLRLTLDGNNLEV